MCHPFMTLIICGWWNAIPLPNSANQSFNFKQYAFGKSLISMVLTSLYFVRSTDLHLITYECYFIFIVWWDGYRIHIIKSILHNILISSYIQSRNNWWYIMWLFIVAMFRSYFLSSSIHGIFWKQCTNLSLIFISCAVPYVIK